MTKDAAPLIFEPHLNMLRPANLAAEEALREVRGRVRVTIKGGVANERRRGLYWLVLSLCVPLLNEHYNLTLDETDLHDILRTKLRMYDEVVLPSGEIYRKLHSTSNKAMNESRRADFTNSAFHLLSTWTGVDVHTLQREAENTR